MAREVSGFPRASCVLRPVTKRRSVAVFPTSSIGLLIADQISRMAEWPMTESTWTLVRNEERSASRLLRLFVRSMRAIVKRAAETPFFFIILGGNLR